MLVNILLGAAGLLLTNLLAALAATRILLPMLIRLALQQHAPLGMLVVLGLIALRVWIGVAIGACFAWQRQTASLAELPVATALFLCVTLVLAVAGGVHASAAMIGLAALLEAVTVLAFWLPLAIRAWRDRRFGPLPFAACAIGLATVLAVCLMSRISNNVAVLAPLRPNPNLPGFGDQAAAAGSLANATLANGTLVEDPSKRANRAAVIRAADRMRGNACDPRAYFELRHALLVFLNNHVEQWYRTPTETIAVQGHAINAARQLDEPALTVFRQAAAAGIIHLEELPEGVRRELSFGHITQANPASAEVASLICAR